MKIGILFVLMAGSALFHLGCDDSGGSGIPACSGTFNACGGDLEGKWAIDGLCLEGDIRSGLSETFAKLPSQCSDFYQDTSMRVSGTVEFADGKQTFDAETSTEIRFRYTSACLSAASKRTITLSQSVCDDIAGEMESSMKEDGTDADVKCSLSGACNCTASISKRDRSSTSYRVNGSTLTTDDGDTAEFCVSGNTLTVRDDKGDGLATQTKLHKI